MITNPWIIGSYRQHVQIHGFRALSRLRNARIRTNPLRFESGCIHMPAVCVTVSVHEKILDPARDRKGERATLNVVQGGAHSE